MAEVLKLLETVLSSLAILTISTLLIISTYHFKKNLDASSSFTPFMWTFCITAALYIVYNIFKLYTSVVPEELSNPGLCQVYWQSYDLYLIGKLFMYLFYCHRVFETFKSSTFALSAKAYKLLIICVSVYYLSISIAFATECALWSNQSLYPLAPTIDKNDFETWADCVKMADYYVLRPGFVAKIALLFIGETLFAVILLRLYVRKVLLVTSMAQGLEVSMNSVRTRSASQSMPRPSTTSSQTVASTSTASSMENENQNIDDSFLQIAVKSTNLVIFSLITSILTAMLFEPLGRWLIILDTLVNFICMYLTFKFAKVPYSILCWGTHKACWVICVSSCFRCCVHPYCACDCCQRNKDEIELSAAHKNGVPISK